ncbi:hypothetical protein ACFV9E_33425, partial [Streptomyces sp. NPDC059835]
MAAGRPQGLTAALPHTPVRAADRPGSRPPRPGSRPTRVSPAWADRLTRSADRGLVRAVRRAAPRRAPPIGDSGREVGVEVAAQPLLGGQPGVLDEGGGQRVAPRVHVQQ